MFFRQKYIFFYALKQLWVCACKFTPSLICWGEGDWTICRESKKIQLFYVPVSYFQVTVLMEVGNIFNASLTNSIELAPKSLFYLKLELCQQFVGLKVRRILHRSIICSVINSRYSNSVWKLYCRHLELQPQIRTAYSNVP